LTTRAHGLLLLILALAPLPASAQSSSERARRLLEDGREYRQRKMMTQAIAAFGDIVTSFPESDSADDALLELGDYYLNDLADVEKARAAFEQVTKTYAQSDGAPGAYYWLGFITLNRATTSAELDDAMAQFTRVQSLYPRSQWVGSALYGMGRVHRKAGKLEEAIEYQRRVVLEYPVSPAAPAAQFEIGRCYAVLGNARQAMEEFQQVRNRFPEKSDWPARALDQITSLWRLHGEGQPSLRYDSSYSLAVGEILKDVSSILMTPEGTLWLGSGKARAAVPIADGKPGASVALEEPRALALSPRGEIVVAGRLAVRIGPKDIKAFAVPADKVGEMENLEKITAAVQLPGGILLVADEKRKRVFRYDAQSRFQGPFPDAKEREVTRLSLDGEGGIVMLDERDKSVRVFDVSGRQLRAIGAKGAGYEIKKPVDVAVDELRNTYIADAEGGIYIFGPAGQLVTVVAGTGEMRRPRALTLEADGALLVYDERAEKVLRYR
jgi:tetratricopeptide (TPR) repeat protein